MIRWATVHFGCDTYRYKLLSEIMTNQGLKNEWTDLEVSPSDFLDRLPEIQNEFDQLRLDTPFRHTSFSGVKKHEAEMLVLRSGDTFYKDGHGKWWLRSATFYGMEAVLNQMDKSLDPEGSALIVGAGGGARAAISALVKAGMSTFNITNAFDDQVIDLIKELKKIYFSIEFNFVSQGQLVLLSGTNSVVVNSTPYSATNEIVKELSYFNFLKSPGIIWELSIDPIETELVTEASQIGASVVKGHEFASEADKKWIQWIAPESYEFFDSKLYQKELLKQATFKAGAKM